MTAIIAISVGLRVLMKSNHAAYRASILQGGEAFVDPGKPDALRDELVQHQAPVEIGVARGASVPIARPPDPFLLHERAPAKGDVRRNIDLAEPDDLSARPHGFDAGTQSNRA